MYKLLLVTQDSATRNLLKTNAQADGFQVTEEQDGKTALQLCLHDDFDVIVIDTALSQIDGFYICSEIRKAKQTPVILISSSHNESDKLLGFEVGGDDFMVKPLSPRILIARAKAIISRVNRFKTTA